MGDTSVLQAREELSSNGIPTFRTPEAATDALDFLHVIWSVSSNCYNFPIQRLDIQEQMLKLRKPSFRAELHNGSRVLNLSKQER